MSSNHIDVILFDALNVGLHLLNKIDVSFIVDQNITKPYQVDVTQQYQNR